MNATTILLLATVVMVSGCQDSGHEETEHHEHDQAPPVELPAAGTPDNLLVIDRGDASRPADYHRTRRSPHGQ